MKQRRIEIYFLAIISVLITAIACKKDSSGSGGTTAASITALTCSGVTYSATATSGVAYSATAAVPYTGGNSIAYSAGTAISSTGVTIATPFGREI